MPTCRGDVLRAAGPTCWRILQHTQGLVGDPTCPTAPTPVPGRRARRADNRASPPDQSNGPWGRLLEPESRVPSQSKQLRSGRAQDRTSGLTVRELTHVCPVDTRRQPFTRLMGRSATVPRSGDQAHSPRSGPCRPLAITSPPTAVLWSVPKESAMSPRGKRMSGADRRNGLKSLQRLMPTPGIEPGTY